MPDSLVQPRLHSRWPVADEPPDLDDDPALIEADYIPPEYPPSSPELIIKNCANMAHFAKTGCAAEGEEPLWKACLGVMAFADNGYTVARNWSMKDERFDEAEFQKKFDLRKRLSGASLCTQFHDDWDTASKTRCEACSHFGNINSPIVLGYAPMSAEQVDEAIVATKPLGVCLEDFISYLPKDDAYLFIPTGAIWPAAVFAGMEGTRQS